MSTTDHDLIRVIFGLKLKQLRASKGLSLLELSQKSGLSLSYINEIEKGKKYPKAEKIMALSKGLEVSYDSLVSLKVNKTLAPALDVLNSPFMKEFPLDIFGIEPQKLMEMVANAPAKVNAFINAMAEIATQYDLTSEHFYFAALRSYQVLHHNYFEELEDAAAALHKQLGLKEGALPKQKHLETYLTQRGYNIVYKLPTNQPLLQSFRSILVTGTVNTLYINANLNDEQRLFQLARECGYVFMNIKLRPFTSTWIKVHSFEEVLNNFKASYFANSLLIPATPLLADIEKLFAAKKWNEEQFLQLFKQYAVSPETLFHRLTNLLPKYWGIQSLFFLRITKSEQAFSIDKELHIGTAHKTYSNETNLHYCRRWLAVSLLNSKTKKAGIQQSHYVESKRDFLIISCKVSANRLRQSDTSYSLGLLIGNELKRKANFLQEIALQQKEVNVYCESCSVKNCKERAAEPTLLSQANIIKQTEEALAQFMKL